MRYSRRLIMVAEPAELSAQEMIVKVVQKNFIEVTGKPVIIGGFVATTDARFLVNQAKILSVIFGLGSVRQAPIRPMSMWRSSSWWQLRKSTL